MPIDLIDLTTRQIVLLAYSCVITLGIMAIYLQVFGRFKASKTHKEDYVVKSRVETLSMSAFFVVVYLTVRFGIGSFGIPDGWYYPLSGLAIVVLAIGVFFNLRGRDILGKNWGNHVVIYKDHELVTSGVYRIVRHPLYASIIWMIFAVGVIYANYWVFILNAVVFIPAMYYRAKQEEAELLKRFKDYKKYKKAVGMFFPKPGRLS